MTTKLVYVLTCAPEANYIEQALMSVWSARHWNPDAHIVLITDNLTDQLFVGKRAEILDYISEKIVVPFEDDSLSMMYRSRWIKTSVRQLITGDFLFIDCDTIVCKSLNDIDSFECKIGAVRDSNIDFNNDFDKEKVCAIVNQLSTDISKDEYYFSSGVIFVKDNKATHCFYELWHTCWLQGIAIGISIDQPSFAKANIECGHLIYLLGDEYNCVLYTQSPKLLSASIIHIPSYRNPCFLFTQSIYAYLRQNGLQQWICNLVINIQGTYLPFDYWIKHSSFSKRLYWIRNVSKMLRLYGQNIDSHYSQINFKIGAHKAIIFLLRLHLYRLAMSCWMIWKRMQLTYTKRTLKANICHR